MITLAIDASTYEGSVAVVRGVEVVAESRATMRGRDVERLMPAVRECLNAAGMPLSSVDRVVCGAGPGSFTSLRIAGSIAKGMALGAGKPLFAVSSLGLIVAGNISTETQRYVAVLDALRGEYFAAMVNVVAGLVSEAAAPSLVRREELPEFAERHHAILAGPGMDLSWAPLAVGVARMGAMIDASGPVDVASWEPTYGRLAEAQVKLEAGRL